MCQNTCKLCKRLILSQAVTFADDVLNINIPSGTYASGGKYCLVIAQAIPNTTTVNSVAVVTIGDSETTYPLTDCGGNTVTAGHLRTRTKYVTHVATTPTGGSFRLAGKICDSNNLTAITG